LFLVMVGEAVRYAAKSNHTRNARPLG